MVSRLIPPCLVNPMNTPLLNDSYIDTARKIDFVGSSLKVP